MCASSEEELQEIISAFSTAYTKLGLSLNVAKTEVLYQSYPATLTAAAENPPSITVSGHRLKVASKFKYLGMLKSPIESVLLQPLAN